MCRSSRPLPGTHIEGLTTAIAKFEKHNHRYRKVDSWRDRGLKRALGRSSEI